MIALLEALVPTAAAPPVEWPGWEPVISKLEEIERQLGELEIKITAPDYRHSNNFSGDTGIV